MGWPAIRSGQDVVLSAPTGSGKTLAAFLVTLDELLRTSSETSPRVHTIYVSPLRALGHDIHRTLQQPLAELASLARERGRPWPGIEAGVRTADTPARQRRAMARRPPHILVTTPESFFLMLLSPATRPALLRASRVIVDEVHALAPSKRGVLLALSLELRDLLAGARAQRVGLSATIEPPEAAAVWLGGAHAGEVRVLEAGGRKPLTLEVIVPGLGLPEDEGSVWTSVARRLLELIEAHRATLVFVNNRRLAERLTHLVNDLAGRRLTMTHHGSMARPARLYVEEALKSGALKAVVATSTLELGIDVGTVDLVVQVQSPKQVAQGLQRLGRSGHAVTGTSHGVLLATHPADLLEAAAAARAMVAGDIEPTRLLSGGLDVLAQFVVGATVVQEWDEEELLRLVRRTAAFSDLSREMFQEVLALVAGELPGGRWRPRVRWDRQHGRIRSAEGALTVLYAGSGTIPDRGLYPVYLQGTDVKLGELDEEFTYERRRGDVFRLGMGTWRIEAIKPDRVLVSPAPHEGPALVPFWRGDAQGRSTHLGRWVGETLAQMAERLKDCPSDDAAHSELRRWLREHACLDEAAADALVSLVVRQWRACGTLPTDRRVVVETFPDELGDRRIVLHSPWGRAVHRAWALAIEGYLRARGLTPDTLAADDGVMVRLPAEADVDPDELCRLGGEDPVALVHAWLPGSPLVAQRFREAATRALLIPRSHRARRQPLWLQRLRAADLLAQATRAGAARVLLQEALREAAAEDLDVETMARLVRGLQRGEIERRVVERRVPSPLAAAMLAAFTQAYLYRPDAPKAEGRATLLMGDPEELLRQAAAAGHLERLVDERAFQEVAERHRFPAWLGHRPPDTIDRLEDWLRFAGDLSYRELEEAIGTGAPWQTWMDALRRQGRVMRRRDLWVHALLAPALEALDADDPQQRIEALAALLSHRLSSRPGPWRVEDVADRYGVPAPVAQGALQVLEARGLVLLATLRAGEAPGYVAVAGLLEARRRTLERARAEAAPVPISRYRAFVMRRHGLLRAQERPDTNAETELLLQRLSTMAGVRARWSDWLVMLAGRLGRDPRPDLARAIASGQVGWAVVADGQEADREPRVTLFPRTRASGANLAGPAVSEPQLPAEARAVLAVLQRGGSWFGWELASHAGLDMETAAGALLALVRAGLVGAESIELLEAVARAPRRDVPAAVGLSPGTYRRRARAVRRAVRRALSRRAGARPDVSLVRFYRVGHELDQRSRQAEAWAEALLARYGIVSRSVAIAEGIPLPWSYVAQALETMEAQGRVLRVWAVEGLEGEQFARGPDIEALRSEAAGAGSSWGHAWATATVDPVVAVALAGHLPSWWPAGPPTGLVAGVGPDPILLLRPASGGLWHDPAASPEALRQALESAARLAGAAFPGRRLIIRTVQGVPVTQDRGHLAWIREAGFAEGPHTLERWV